MERNDQQPVMFFLGDAALDEYYQADYFPRLKEKITVQPLPAESGGMVANAACVSAALGCQTHFLAMLKDSEITEKLLTDMRKGGIETKWVIYDNDLPEAKTIIILAEGEHTVFIPTLGIDKIEIANTTLDFIKTCDYFFTTMVEFGPLVCEEKTSYEVLCEIQKAGCRTVFDMDVNGFAPRELKFLQAIDILFINEKGFEQMKGDKSQQERVEDLFSYGLEILIITKGDKGCFVYQGENMWQIPGIPTEVVDVTGAGDTFAGAFMYAYHKWQDPKKAAVFSVGAATRCVSTLGARSGTAREEEVLSFLSQKGISFPAE